MPLDDFEVVWNGAVNGPNEITRPVEDAEPMSPRSIWPSKICAGCGDSFRVRPSEAPRRRHCSRACTGNGDVAKTCPWCLGPFTVAYKDREQVHCSKRCLGASSAARRTSARMSEMGRQGGLKAAAQRAARKAQA